MDGKNELPTPRRKPTDHIINSVKALLATVPFTGGIASVIADYVPKSTERAVWKAIEYLNARLDALGNRIDRNTVDEDEFSDSIKSFLRLSQRSSQDEKLKAAANILANIMLKDGDPDKLSYSELDHFSRCVESLSIGALRVLGECYSFAKRHPLNKTAEGFRVNSGELIRQIEEQSPDLIMSLVTELDSWNLVQDGSRQSFARTYAEIRGMSYCSNIPLHLTRMGIKFVEHILRVED